MHAPYGILLVGGSRSHQEGYAAQFGADPRCRLIGVSDEDGIPPNRVRWNQELADQLGIPLLPRLDQALERPDVGVVSVCAEFERRARVAALCALAGKHVYVDQPVATTNQDAAQLVSAVRRAKVKSQTFSMLGAPWAQRALGLVRSGQLGDLVGLHCDLLFAKGLTGTADLSRSRREHFPPRRFTFIDSKRELFATGVYSIGLMRWISKKRVRRVYAQTANYFFREHQANDVEDFSAATLEFEGNLVGTLSGGRTGWLSHPGSGPMRLFLIGSRGTQLVDSAQPRLEISSDAPPWRPGKPNPADPMGFWMSTIQAMGGVPKLNWSVISGPAQSDQSSFIDCIEEDRESDMSVVEGAEILKVLLVAYQSAATGRPIEIG